MSPAKLSIFAISNLFLLQFAFGIDPYKLLRESIVIVKVYNLHSNRSIQIGTGFLVEDGKKIITARHVVAYPIEQAESYKAEFMLNGVRLKNFEISAIDYENDIAVFKSDKPNGRGLKMAQTAPKKGEYFTSLGYSFGQFSTFKKLKYINRNFEGGNCILHFFGEIHPGMSGGPILNKEGRVVSLNSQVWSQEVTSLSPCSDQLAKAIENAREVVFQNSAKRAYEFLEIQTPHWNFILPRVLGFCGQHRLIENGYYEQSENCLFSKDANFPQFGNSEVGSQYLFLLDLLSRWHPFDFWQAIKNPSTENREERDKPVASGSYHFELQTKCHLKKLKNNNGILVWLTICMQKDREPFKLNSAQVQLIPFQKRTFNPRDYLNIRLSFQHYTKSALLDLTHKVVQSISKN